MGVLDHQALLSPMCQQGDQPASGLSLLNCEMEVSIKNEWNYLHKGPAVLNKQQLILQLDWWDFPCRKHNAGGFTELFYSIYEVGILFIDEETEIQRS